MSPAKALRRERRWSILSKLALLAVLAGGLLVSVAVTVPISRIEAPLGGTIVSIGPATNPKFDPSPLAYVDLPGGEHLVVGIPSGMVCQVGQSAVIHRTRVWLGARTRLGSCTGR